MKNIISKIILVAIAVIILVFVCKWSYGAYQLYQAKARFQNEDKAQVMGMVDKFVSDIVQGSTTDAYNLTDKISTTLTELKDKNLQIALNNYVSQNPNLHYYDAWFMVSGPLSGSELLKYQTEVNLKDDTKGQIEVTAIKGSDGVWKLSTAVLDTPPDHFF